MPLSEINVFYMLFGWFKTTNIQENLNQLLHWRMMNGKRFNLWEEGERDNVR